MHFIREKDNKTVVNCVLLDIISLLNAEQGKFIGSETYSWKQHSKMSRKVWLQNVEKYEKYPSVKSANFV